MSTESTPTPTNEKPTRKFPALCWNQDEALALISAYRDRWYALRRGFLRTADWDAVVAAISVSYPAVPAKTAVQCRHKMEKLRQRYRAEKQRSLSLSTFSLPSSWFFFDSMDSMETGGPISTVGSNPVEFRHHINNLWLAGNQHNYTSVLRIKNVGDRSLVGSVSKPKNLNMGFVPDPVNLGFSGKKLKFEGNYKNPNHGLAYMDEEGKKTNFEGNYKKPNHGLAYMDEEGKRPNFEGNYKNPNHGLAHMDEEGKRPNFEGNYKNPNHGLAYMDEEGKRPNFEGNYKNPNHGFGYIDEESDGDGVEEAGFGSGVRFRIPFEEKVVAPVLKAKKFGRVVQGDYCGDYSVNQYYVNGLNEELPPGFKVKGKMNMNSNSFYPDVGSRENNLVRCEMNTKIPNGVPSFGYGFGKTSGRRRGVKRKRGAIDEMVSSIKLLGEGFVRMEKMKMDMAREMEKTRMEMELKRYELILESQRQIVDAFVSILLENNTDSNKKKKETQTTTVVPES